MTHLLGDGQPKWQRIIKNTGWPAENAITARLCGGLPGSPVSVPASDQFPFQRAYFHKRGSEDHLHPSDDVFVGYRVVVHVTSEIDTAVFLDKQTGIELGLIASLGQRAQIRLLDGQEQFLAGLRTLLHTPLVTLPHLLEDGRIYVLYGIEGLRSLRQRSFLQGSPDGVRDLQGW